MNREIWTKERIENMSEDDVLSYMEQYINASRTGSVVRSRLNRHAKNLYDHIDKHRKVYFKLAENDTFSAFERMAKFKAF